MYHTYDWANPGFMEYLSALIMAGLVFLMVFMIWFANHTHSKRVNSIVDKIRARGPVATVSLHGDGTVTVEQHKTIDDIRQDVADEYGVRLDQVTHCGGGHWQIQPDAIEDQLREELTAHPI
jgi:hypothetical protein